ncbi:NlpC/P60 family protein [Bhargavaea ginsengi]|uniref:C40 family peptidase n=1 Tax=Bhargavaea ginsengi TaxID=426757 RepID=UPI00203EAF3B|nr:C40 family peptidase [Bhargavaea ginsengi]MCM3088095.1 NlpC/P60 family protein [Bhargavaea ginsengi]
MKRFLCSLAAVATITAFSPQIEAEAASVKTTESQLMNIADDYIGVPYKWGGTTTSGFDCSGYIQYVFKKAGVSVPRTTSQMAATGTAVSKSNLQVGDLVFFNTSGRGISHAGIYAGNNNFIHASSSRGVMITSLSDPYYWGSKYVTARRVVDFPAKAQEVAQVAAPKPAVNQEAYVTRLEAAEELVNKLGLKASQTSKSYFKDIPANHPKIAVLNAVYEAGIFTGSNGNFNADQNLNRTQMAKILVEAYDLEGQTNPGFHDVPNNYWAAGYIYTLYHNNVTTGYANGNYGIYDPLYEIQLDKFIDRLN